MNDTSTDSATLQAPRPRFVPQVDSLAVRLILFAVVLVVITAGLIGALAYTRARHALEREARTRLAIIARDVAQGLDREIADRAADIRSWARLEVMRAVVYEDVDKELAQFIRQIVTGRQAYLGILCLGPGGKLVASAGDVGPAVPDPSERAFDAPLTRVSLVKGSGKLDRLLQFETPIFDPEHADRVVAMLLVLVDAQQLLRTAQTSLGAIGARLAFEVRDLHGHTMISSMDDRWDSTIKDDDLLIGTTRLGRAIANAPELEVVVSEPAREALATVTALRGALLKTVSIVLLVSSMLGAIVAWRIGRPIRHLTDAVHAITNHGQLQPGWELPEAPGEVALLAAAFRAMMERLAVAQAEAVMQSRLALLGEIAANVAHEVRTPLSVLKTSAQLLARRELPADEQRQLSAAVIAEVDRLNSVVTDLVDLARPKRIVYRLESLPAILRRAVAFFTTTAQKHGVELEHRIESNTLFVQGSVDQLYQVMLNLIHNALQALTSPGRIVVRCRRDGAWIVTDVEDTGPGFSLEILSKAFSRFCTTKADGTGLGLAISRRIVEEHGGTIIAENLLGEGARVRIRLPSREEEA